MWLIAATLFISGVTAGSLELDVPSSVANRSIAIKGQLFCGKRPFEGAKIRLFRTYQKNAADDLSQLLGSVQTYVTGNFQVEGTTANFPDTQTEIQPFVTFHHFCDMDERQKANQGYKRWSIRLPEEYVTLGTRARKVYDFGKINLQMQYPGESHDKKFNFNEVVTVQGTILCGKTAFEGAKIRLYHTPQREIQEQDEHTEIVASVATNGNGTFMLKAVVVLYPIKDYRPYLTVHHTCDMTEKEIEKLGHRRWTVRIPDDYVSDGSKSRKIYDMGLLNVQMQFPGESYDKSFNPNW